MNNTKNIEIFKASVPKEQVLDKKTYDLMPKLVSTEIKKQYTKLSKAIKLHTITEQIYSTPELTPQEWMSPTSINTYYKCPRSYFYNYIAKIKTGDNIHLIKGIVVHKVLEDFFKVYNKNPRAFILELFDETWASKEKSLNNLELTPEELKTEHDDALNMVIMYYNRHKEKIDGLILAGKVENEQHAFYLVKPKFREMYVKNEDLKVRGYIDRVHKDFNDIITIGDYKTSKRYGVGLSEDYERQMSIYSLLYHEQEKVMPDMASVIFLRYGEEPLLKVTPSVLKCALDSITDARSKTRSTNIEAYPLKEGKLCGWCDYLEYCNGTKEWKDASRKQHLKKLFKKPKVECDKK